MPSSGLSERDRLRLEQLMQAPLVPPRTHATASPHPNTWQWPKKALNAGRNRIAGDWNALSAAKVKTHLVAHWRGWAAGVTVMATCLMLLGVAVIFESRGNTGSIQLQALDRKGQLQIRWDPESDLIRRAVGAKLYITDGSQRIFVQLDGTRLRRGAVSYARRSDRVELRMTLAEPDGKSIEEQATFLGTRPPKAADFQLEASARPVPPPARTSASNRAASSLTAAEHRARRKPLVQSGTDLPFTCSAGDIFRKTNAPPGWDTFACRGKNVWGIATSQLREEGSASRPNANATTLTAKPASATR